MTKSTKISRRRISDQTRNRIYSLINMTISLARAGGAPTRKEFIMTEGEIKDLWAYHGLITPLQKNLGDALNPVVELTEQLSAGQVSVRKIKGVGGIGITVHTYGAVK